MKAGIAPQNVNSVYTALPGNNAQGYKTMQVESYVSKLDWRLDQGH